MRLLRNRHQRNMMGWSMVVLGLTLAMVAWAGLSSAQQQDPVGASDDQVQAFAKAHVEVTKIHSNAQIDKELPKTIAKVNADSVPDKETRERIIQAIEAEGLTVEDYNALMEAYQTSENFRSKVTMTILDLH